MSEWKPYLGDRLIKRCDGFVVIKPIDDIVIIPLSCPICDTLMRSHDDEEAFHSFNCCHFCALEWAHARREAWSKGWRPTREQIVDSMSRRPPLSVPLEID
jgi:hypothetical protein